MSLTIVVLSEFWLSKANALLQSMTVRTEINLKTCIQNGLIYLQCQDICWMEPGSPHNLQHNGEWFGTNLDNLYGVR